MIELVDIQKSFDAYQVLKGISFALKRGEVVGLLGKNGVGKTTLLKIICGVSQDYTGQLIWDDTDIQNSVDYRKKVGFLSEKNPLYLGMYVREYLDYIIHHYYVPNPKQVVQQTIDMVGLSDKAHLKINQLSKGYKQRIGLAASILHDPEILVLDEPINGLDPQQILQYRSLLRQMSTDRIIILSSHLIQEIEAVCDRVLYIADGVIAREEVLNQSDDQAKAFALETSGQIDRDSFLALSTIADVQNIEGHRYHIRSVEGLDCRQEVFKYLSDHGLYILSLAPIDKDLNQLFYES
jgi:ABC-2 type transport system ATP-binding protein